MRLQLEKYFRDRISLIQKLVKAYETSLDEELLHTLRVEIKKVRFINFVLAEHVSKRKAEKLFKPFGEFFKILGKVRGQHVNLYRLSIVDASDSEAHRHFSEKIEKVEQKAKSDIDKFLGSLHKNISSWINNLSKLKNYSADQHVNFLIKQIKKQFQGDYKKRSLHQSRHLLKAVIYSSEISQELYAMIEKTFNLETINKLEDAIGDWHDLSILLKSRNRSALSKKAKKKIKEKRKGELKLFRELIPKILKQN